jgi:hypothetical protein
MDSGAHGDAIRGAAAAVGGECVVCGRNASSYRLAPWCGSSAVAALGRGGPCLETILLTSLAQSRFNQSNTSSSPNLHVEALSTCPFSLLFARHVWPAVSPSSAMRHALCCRSARRCSSCEQTACRAHLLCRLQGILVRPFGPGRQVCAAIASREALLTSA